MRGHPWFIYWAAIVFVALVLVQVAIRGVVK